MAWDSSRPVPWIRLMREWVIYAVVISAIFLLLFRDDNIVGAIAGVLISGPLYLAFGFVLAKFGYKRKTMADYRADRAVNAQQELDERKKASADERPRPAPTKRTSQGPNRPPKRKRR